MRLNTIWIIILAIFSSCDGQEKGKISSNELQELFEREKKNETRAKYGGNSSEIQIITKQEEIERLKNYVTVKNSDKLSKKLAEGKNKTLSERYKSGDKTVIPQIIEILGGNDTDSKNEIYNGLRRRYDEAEEYNISEPELAIKILKNISIREDEKSVIQLAGFMQLEGYPEVFEKQLLSGKSQDEERLIYWLGAEGKSEKVLEYIKNLILDENFDFEDNDYVMSGLVGFFEEGNDTIRKETFEICLDIYNRQLIAKEKFEEMNSSWSSSNPAIDLTKILLESEDERAIPIAKQFIENDIIAEKALVTLIKLEGVKHNDLLFKYLTNQDSFFDALNPAVEMYTLTKDKSIVETILKEFEKRDKHPDFLIDRVVSAMVSMDATEYFLEFDKTLKSELLINSMTKHYALLKSSVETVAKDLFDMGVVDSSIDQRIIDEAKKLSNGEETEGFIYNLLTVSQLFQWFDAETGTLPVDYDNLILEFSNNSNGKLKDIMVWMDTDVDQDYNVKYKIYVSANNKIYIMTPEDIGDWYDVKMILNLMNTIAKDAKLNERYVFIDTGDQTVQILFGPIENVNDFVKKYNL